MRPRQTHPIPEAAGPFEGWVQLANPSASDSVTLDRFRAGPSELLDVTVPDLCISLCRSPGANAQLRDDGGAWRAAPNDSGGISFVSPGSLVSLRWNGTADSINLVVRAGLLDAPGDAHSVLSRLRQPIFGLRDKLAAGLIEDIYRDNLEGYPFGSAYAETMALAVLYRIVSARGAEAPEQHALRNAQAIALAIDFIQEHIDANLSLNEIVKAAQCTTNVHAFIRAFRRHCGMAPHQYIIKVRLDKAKTMLLSNRHSITTIALSCGFSSLSHFSGAFKRRWGVSPTELIRERSQNSHPHPPGAPQLPPAC